MNEFDLLLAALEAKAKQDVRRGKEEEAELIRRARTRLLAQQSFIVAFAQCADELLTPEQQASIPGSGMDGYRDAGNLRNIIAALITPP